MGLKGLDFAAVVLIVIGGLNWGLVGLVEWNLIDAVFGFGVIARIIYVLVGAAAVYVALRASHLAHLDEPVPTESEKVAHS